MPKISQQVHQETDGSSGSQSLPESPSQVSGSPSQRAPTQFAIWIGWTCTGLALLVGFVVRLVVVGEPLWLDELHTSWVVTGPFSLVLPRATIGNQAPLYFWLEWLIVNVTELDRFNLRVLSLASSMFLVYGCVWCVWHWTRCLLASVSVAWILAFDPLTIFYATEARPYAMLQFLGLVQIVLFWMYWNAARNPQPPKVTMKVGLIVVSVILFYTHYTSGLIFLAEAFFVSIVAAVNIVNGYGSASEADKPSDGIPPPEIHWTRVPLRMLPTAFIVLLLSVPAVSGLQMIWGRKHDWTSVSSVDRLWTELAPSWWILILLPGWVVGALAAAHRFRFKATTVGVDLLLPFLATCALTPAALVILADHFRIAPVALSRYLVVPQVAVVLFAGVAIGRCNSRKLRVLLSIFVLGLVAWQNPLIDVLSIRHRFPRFRHENWQQPIEMVNRMDEYSPFPVFQFANILEDASSQTHVDNQFQDYLLFPLRGVYPIGEQDRQLIPMPTHARQPFSQAQIQYAKGQGGAWLIIRAARADAIRIVNALKKTAGDALTLDEYSSPDNDIILVLVRFR